MPVIIDPERVEEGEKPDWDKGVPVNIEGQTDVVLTKFITTNPNKACWAPDPTAPWGDEVTTDLGGGRRSVRIGIIGKDGEPRSVNVDDGLIMWIEGRMAGLVGLMPGRPPMNQAEVDAYMDQNDRAVPMYQQWDFRVASVKKTNGPEEREKMHRSDDQKRINSQDEMFQAFKKMFEMGAGKFAAGEGNPQEILAAGVAEAVAEESSVGSFSTEPLPEHISNAEKIEAAATAQAEGIQTE
jgi:hypothetical protein